MFNNRKDTGKFLNNFLSRHHRRLIGWGLIILSIAMFCPPFIPTFDDLLLNVPIATWLATQGIPTDMAIVSTYTLIPFTILVIAVIVFPEKDGKVERIIKRRLTATFKKAAKSLKKPQNIALAAIAVWIVFNAYKIMLAKAGMI